MYVYRFSVLCAILAVGIAAWPAQAYGPSTHMREAEHYIEILQAKTLPDPHHDPQLLENDIWMLRLGSIWPDLAGPIFKSTRKVDEHYVNPHNRHLNIYMLEQALAQYPTDPWKVAFAVGCLLHNTGDLVSQDMFTQHLAARAWTGELNVFNGIMDDHVGGENEGLVEAGLEIAFPALDLYLDMADHFILDPDGRARLQETYDFFAQIWDDFFADPAAAPEPEGFDHVIWELADLRRIVIPEGVTAVQLSGLALGLAETHSAGKSLINWGELVRMLSGPLATPGFFDMYYDEGYFDLSPTIMLTFEPGQGCFDYLPNWSSKIMRSGSIISLNSYLPDHLAYEDGIFIYDQKWISTNTGEPVFFVDATAASEPVTLIMKVFMIPGRTPTDDVVTMRIREDTPERQVVAAVSGNVYMDAFEPGTYVPITLSVGFTPAESIGRNARGFFAELAHGEDPEALPFFTTDWSLYQRIDVIDFSADAYVWNYSTYNHWPFSLKVTSKAPKVPHSMQRAIAQ